MRIENRAPIMAQAFQRVETIAQRLMLDLDDHMHVIKNEYDLATSLDNATGASLRTTVLVRMPCSDVDGCNIAYPVVSKLVKKSVPIQTRKIKPLWVAYDLGYGAHVPACSTSVGVFSLFNES